MLDVDAPDLTFAECSDRFQEFDRLSLQPKVRERRLWPWAVVCSHFQLLDDLRRGAENRLTAMDAQALDAAKGFFLQQLNKQALLTGERGLRDLLIQNWALPSRIKVVPVVVGRIR